MLSTNVVSANAARPSGPGSAGVQPSRIARVSGSREALARSPTVASRVEIAADSMVSPSPPARRDSAVAGGIRPSEILPASPGYPPGPSSILLRLARRQAAALLVARRDVGLLCRLLRLLAA